MAYNESAMRASIKYVKEHQKQIVVKYKKEEFDQDVKPAIEKSGLPTATFIKQAIAEKIKRDGLT